MHEVLKLCSINHDTSLIIFLDLTGKYFFIKIQFIIK